jgi:hypothetical protein
MTFDYTFTHSNDTIYFAYCIPYTYTFLLNFIHAISNQSITNMNTFVNQ